MVRFCIPVACLWAVQAIATPSEQEQVCGGASLMQKWRGPQFRTVQHPTGFNFSQGFARFAGAASVGRKAYFAPNNEPVIGIFDADSNTFSTIPVPYAGHAGAYAGAVAHCKYVYFAPATADNVAKLDTSTNLVSFIDVSPLTGDYKYDGGLIVGSNMYFVPCNANNMGILDLTTDTFRTSEIPFYADVVHNEMLRGWGNGAVVGDSIYLSPWAACVIAVFNYVLEEWSQIRIPGVGCPVQQPTFKYWGAHAHNGVVYFFPSGAPSILRLDVERCSGDLQTCITTLPVSLTDVHPFPHFHWAYTAQVGTRVFMAPTLESVVGVFDMVSETFVGLPFDKTDPQEFSNWGAAAINDTVYFSPFSSDSVLEIGPKRISHHSRPTL